MLNLLVMIEDSPASEMALEATCRLDPGNPVLPIFTAPHANHDLAMGAGWAWKTWERENRHWARKDVEHLVTHHRRQFQNLMTPAVVSGRPVKAVSHRFFNEGHDLIAAGTPFRGMSPETLAHRFQRESRQASRDLPLWIVNDSSPVKTITALTDGSDSAEKALGFLNRLVYALDIRITLIGINETADPSMAREALNLERGFAILREKRINAEGVALKNMELDRLKSAITRTDLLVIPFSSSACLSILNRLEPEGPSILFYLDGDGP